ncbi:hypothetical protein D6T63_10370 [Arthrobacter cheniae]|uniref:Uncharacterized protein n=1 Tax=Arthrobacter cheniae TaxID=1258888 RepID=A0A3A5MCU0_9MICC|nr:hypothetical protein D6T63_10370 [Arthrobacter cheniae]
MCGSDSSNRRSWTTDSELTCGRTRHHSSHVRNVRRRHRTGLLPSAGPTTEAHPRTGADGLPTSAIEWAEDVNRRTNRVQSMRGDSFGR